MDDYKLPKYFKYIIPIVEVLRELGGFEKSLNVINLIVEKRGITEKELLETNQRGKPKVHFNIYSAKSFLAKTGYLCSPKRGLWSLTEKGLKSDLTSMNLADLHRQNRGWRYQWFKPAPEIDDK